MNEVKKCSISGVAFTLDVDAYDALQNYLESLKKNYKQSAEGAEIIADIEARIAELILSTQDNARVVERPLIENIIRQMGSAEDIAGEDPDKDLQTEEPRIPRRLYRDAENAKLGGVCAGIGKYFDLDPVWIRLGMFLPLLLLCMGWIPLFGWFSSMFGNLFGIFCICYLIMWFAVPAARSARQKLEMNGERITAAAIGETTVAASDADAKARPIVAETVSVFGKVVLILLKLFAGLIVFGLIMFACALIIGLFAVIVGGHEILSPVCLQDMSIWLPVLGIFVVLIPAILLIYALMCLIASRKPNGKAVLVIFLLWLASIIGCASLAITQGVEGAFSRNHRGIERIFDNDEDNDESIEFPVEETTDSLYVVNGDSLTVSTKTLRLGTSKNGFSIKTRKTDKGSETADLTIHTHDEDGNKATITINDEGVKATVVEKKADSTAVK